MPRDYLNNVAVCQQCGKKMVGVGARKKWCSHECLLAHQREKYHAQYKHGKAGFATVQKHDTSFCDDCFYFMRYSDGWRCCHYIFVEDTKRPCPPGEGCTVKIKQKVNRFVKQKGNVK